ncbi:MAG TPA: hypothetical protein VMA09_20070 [Candidatus Binataceae bacterium]|nr:hypothetical protein [Candidatus Binataceae bacterium]
MPAKKAKAAPARKSKPKARKAAPASQFDTLRKTVKDLSTRLEKELKARKIEARILSEAKKAREQLSAQVSALRKQGSQLAGELKKALGDSRSYEKAKADAQKKIDQLKKDLSARTSELRRKSEELKKLAEESAHRAAQIIRGEEHPAQEPEPVPEGAHMQATPVEPQPAESPASGDKEPSI